MSRRAAVLAAVVLTCTAVLLGMKSEIVEGNPSSTVRVVIYEDLQCGDCENLRALLDSKVLPRYGKRVVFIHRDFPLGKHDWARSAAVAARWVYAQDPELGITFRREILAEHDHITMANLKPWLLEFAARIKLDRNGMRRMPDHDPQSQRHGRPGLSGRRGARYRQHSHRDRGRR